MYEVKVLSNEEFNALPYPDMDRSLGVADPSTNTAYVRYTGLDVVDKHLIIHELDHLIDGHGGVHSDHYRNGVYYKDIGQTLQTAAPFAAMIPGVGPLISVGMGAGGGALSARSQKKKMGSNSMSGMMGSVAGGPMDSFTPDMIDEKPSAPNIVAPGGSGSGTGSNAIGGMMGGGSPIERVRGFFSSRNPQGAF